MKKIIIFFTLLIFSIGANTFEDFRQQQLGQFEDYKKSIEEDFQNYIKIINEEYAKYRREIREIWNDEKIADKEIWVQYSDNMKNRRIVDFENNTITIEAVVDENKSKEEIEKLFMIEFGNLILTDTKTAYKNDSLMQNIDSRLKKELENHDSESTPDKRPLIADIYLNKESNEDLKLNREDVEKTLEIAKKTVVNTDIKKRRSNEKNKKIVSVNIKMPPESTLRKAAGFKGDVMKYSREERIDPAVVYAIMHSESSFNPMARSHIPAYGLMQIVPQSAGRDVSMKIYREDRIFSPQYLYNSTNNIRAGIAYLSILYYRYLSSIENPRSRLYCTIAAYNTGAGNVARAFTGNTNIRVASQTINKMTPEQVYSKLLRDLPYEETINYLKKVNERISLYDNALQRGF